MEKGFDVKQAAQHVAGIINALGRTDEERLAIWERVQAEIEKENKEEKNKDKLSEKEDGNSWFFDNPYGLPAWCYSTLSLDGSLIILKYGEEGYFPTDYNSPNEGENWALCEHLNEKMGITKAMEEAMVIGSMSGWDSPGCNPALHENMELNKRIANAKKENDKFSEKEGRADAGRLQRGDRRE